MSSRNRALLAWYESNSRTLPWRHPNPDPWAVLVSEVMAQQTQLARVIPAFEQFIERFPTPSDLADADLGDLLNLWGGLGYQRRAINLRKSAALIAAEGWPSDLAGLRSLPGVGPYTAAAIACFAFGAATPAVDTNLRRVVSRWDGEAQSGSRLASRALELLDFSRPADWNQAMMDLGATVCRPREPRCGECPVERWCSDPDVYVPPPHQSPYEGSVRQARAAILKAIASDGRSTVAALRELGINGHLESALDALHREGVIAVAPDGQVTLEG